VARGGRLVVPASTPGFSLGPAPSRSSLVGALKQAEHLRQRTEERPLDYVRWTPPQLGWLQDASPRKLLRAGNQIGKTWAGLAEVIWRATGAHPWLRTHTPPVEIWIVCTTWPQSVAIMRKFWSLLPKHLIKPCGYSARWGFGKENPTVEFTNGSIVRFRTTNQGPDALAGATVHFILIDEPTEEEVYRELDRRLMRNAGHLGLTLTPINRPVEYLRELCRKGAVVDHHARLIPENLIPVGSAVPLKLLDGTPMDAAWIAQQRALTLERFAPVILDGEWELRVEGVYFHAFDPQVHVTDELPDTELTLCLGIDHGERTFKQCAILVGLDLSGEYPRVHVIDEAIGDGETTPDGDARAILTMLKQHGLGWSDLDHVRGDKPYDGTGKGPGRKSNQELERALRKQLKMKVTAELLPPIRQAKKGVGGGRGSIDRGGTWLHHAMVRPEHFTIHPRCERLIECIQKWDYRDTDYKDPIDALRYATWVFAMRGAKDTQRATPSVYLYG
jgi:hypothetical protein